MKPTLFAILVVNLSLVNADESASADCAIDIFGGKSPTWIAGTVRSYNEAVVSSEIFGVVEHIVDPGDFLESGEKIGNIEQEIYLIAIDESRSRIDFLEEKIAHLERKLVASSELLDTSAISELSVGDIRIDLAETRSDHELEKLALRKHEIRLRKSVLLAPIAGVIVERIPRIGELLEVGDPIVRIVDLTNLYVDAYVPANVSTQISKHDRAIVDSPEGIVCGTVDRIIPVALSANNVQVWVKVEGLNTVVGGNVRVAFDGQ